MYINDEVVTCDGFNGKIISVGYPELDGMDNEMWFWVYLTEEEKDVLYSESELFKN